MEIPPSKVFSLSQEEKATSIKLRILAGEKIPLDELIGFLSETDKVLRKEIQRKIAPPSDVDFF